MNETYSPYLSFVPKFYSSTDLQSEPTVGTVLNRVVPIMNIVAIGKLSWYMLIAGTGGSVTPNDYNATTNNVSWISVL